MAKTGNEKLRILYLRDYILQHSDENHPLTIADMKEYLRDDCFLDVPLDDCKSLYRDIRILGRAKDMEIDDESDELAPVTYGMGIVQKGKFYYAPTHPLELQEAKLLVDMVESSRSISERDARALVAKIKSLVSIYQARELDRHVAVPNRAKKRVTRVTESADKIFSAIRDNRAITFQYSKYAIRNGKMTDENRKEGVSYLVSPYALVWTDQNYYMMAYDHNASENPVRAYRVDRMKSVRVSRRHREGEEEYRKLTGGNLPGYINKLFHMFPGRMQTVTIKFRDYLLDSVIDRFGESVSITKSGEDSFTIRTEVSVSSQFFGWLNGFGTGAEILYPQSVRDEMKKYLEDIIKMY